VCPARRSGSGSAILALPRVHGPEALAAGGDLGPGRARPPEAPFGNLTKGVGVLRPRAGRVPRDMDDALRSRRLRQGELMATFAIAAFSVGAVVGLVIALTPDDPSGKRVLGGVGAALALAMIAQLLWLLRRARAQRRQIHRRGRQG